MSDFWQDFESISAAVDRVRDAGARAVQADLDGAVADLSAACSDFIGASVRIRWHQEEKPPVSGAGARKIKEVVRNADGNIMHTVSYWQAEVVPGGVVSIG